MIAPFLQHIVKCQEPESENWVRLYFLISILLQVSQTGGPSTASNVNWAGQVCPNTGSISMIMRLVHMEASGSILTARAAARTPT